MYSTTDETGLLNNFAAEPKMYLAAPPAPEQKRRYWLQGGLAVLLVGALAAITLAVS